MKCGLVLLLVGCGLAAQAGACPDDASWKPRLIEMVNALRATGGTCSSEGVFEPGAPVSWNPALESVAAAHTAWMAERGELVHVGRRGEGLGERVKVADYRYERVAENIAAGYPEMAQVIEAWRKSAKHCRNLLDPRFTEVALACVRAPNGPWWTITLGRPSSSQAAGHQPVRLSQR